MLGTHSESTNRETVELTRPAPHAWVWLCAGDISLTHYRVW